MFIQLSSISAQAPIPQLQAGVYINDSLDFIDYYLIKCKSSYGVYDVSVFIDTNLIPVASGVELKFVVTQLTTLPDSVYSTQNGILHLYDTLTFSLSKSSYTIYSTDTGLMRLKIIIVGTPTIPFETYHCQFSKLITLSNCMNGSGIRGSQTCSVENFNGINEPQLELKFKLMPNPTSDYLDILDIHSISSVSNVTVFKLINLQGQIVQSEILPANFKSKRIKVDKLSDGIYIWKVSDQFGFEETGKVVINKTE
jgi:hypothetical protein